MDPTIIHHILFAIYLDSGSHGLRVRANVRESPGEQEAVGTNEPSTNYDGNI